MSTLERASATASQPVWIGRWLALLVLVAAVAVARALLFPPRPQLADLEAAPFNRALRQAGLVALPQASLPGRVSADRALSSTLVWTLAGGQQLQILQGRSKDFPQFQLAMLTSGVPGLQLRERRLDQPSPGSALGRIDGRPAIQTCLVPQFTTPPTAAVSQRGLHAAVEQVARSRPDRLLALLGLRPNRVYACVIVSLRSPTTAALPAPLWPRLLLALQPALEQQPAGRLATLVHR